MTARRLKAMVAALALAAVVPAIPAQAGQSAQAALPASLHAQLDAQYDQVIADLIRITETPAPPFKEAARAALFAQMLG